MDDQLKGNIYRIAPKGFEPKVPACNLKTLPGQVAALGSTGSERPLRRGEGSHHPGRKSDRRCEPTVGESRIPVAARTGRIRHGTVGAEGCGSNRRVGCRFGRRQAAAGTGGRSAAFRIRNGIDLALTLRAMRSQPAAALDAVKRLSANPNRSKLPAAISQCLTLIRNQQPSDTEAIPAAHGIC